LADDVVFASSLWQAEETIKPAPSDDRSYRCRHEGELAVMETPPLRYRVRMDSLNVAPSAGDSAR
jgi:hypothetical protein